MFNAKITLWDYDNSIPELRLDKLEVLSKDENKYVIELAPTKWGEARINRGHRVCDEEYLKYLLFIFDIKYISKSKLLSQINTALKKIKKDRFFFDIWHKKWLSGEIGYPKDIFKKSFLKSCWEDFNVYINQFLFDYFRPKPFLWGFAVKWLFSKQCIANEPLSYEVALLLLWEINNNFELIDWKLVLIKKEVKEIDWDLEISEIMSVWDKSEPEISQPSDSNKKIPKKRPIYFNEVFSENAIKKIRPFWKDYPSDDTIIGTDERIIGHAEASHYIELADWSRVKPLFMWFYASWINYDNETFYDAIDIIRNKLEAIN